LTGAFTLAFVIRVQIDDRPLIEPITANGYIAVVALLLLFWLFVYSLLGLYKSYVYENRFKEALLLFVGSFIGILFLIGAEYVLNRAVFPARLVTVYGFGLGFLLTLLMRTVSRAVRRTMYRYGKGIANVLLIGTTDITGELANKLSAAGSGYKVVGIVGDRRNKYPNIKTSIQYRDFAEASKRLKTADIHSIVQTELFADGQQNDEILAFAQEHHIAYRYIPSNNRLFVGSIDVTLFEGIPTVAVHQTALIGWGRIAKRLFDIFISGSVLVLLLPLLLLVGLVAKILNPREPLIFTQTRLTRFNQPFKIYKFRSQYHKYDGTTPEEAFAMMDKPGLSREYRTNGDFLKHDPRVIPFGKFLRKTSIDELPQLFNVFRGDLSLVGPRPLIPQELNKFNKKSVILSVKPGIAGLAVISGRRDIVLCPKLEFLDGYSNSYQNRCYGSAARRSQVGCGEWEIGNRDAKL